MTQLETPASHPAFIIAPTSVYGNMALLQIIGGTVCGPSDGIEGPSRNLWLQDGKIIVPPNHTKPQTTIDATGPIVTPFHEISKNGAGCASDG